jgi:hypothetical protein
MRLLVALSTLTLLGLGVFASVEAQSQAGGLPAVSARVQVLEGIATTLQTQVTTLQTQVTTLQTANTTLQTQVTTLQTDNTALQAALDAETAARRNADITLVNVIQNGDRDLRAAIEAIRGTIGNAFEVTVPSTFLVNGQLGTVAMLENVPAGRYLVIAKAIVLNVDNDAEWHCRLLRNNDQFPNVLDRSAATTESGFIENTSNMTMVGIATLPAPGSFRVDCFTLKADSDLHQVKIVAVSVQ